MHAFPRNPAKILVKKEELTLEGIRQYYVTCSNDANKYDNLFEIFSNIDVQQCIIYVNTKEKATKLAQYMKEKEFVVSCIHGSMEHDERINATYPAFEAALKAAGVNYRIHVYPGTQHGFHNNSTPRYDEAAAKLSWERTLEHFRTHLS